MKFNIITSICQKGGISRRGYIPWENSLLYRNMFERLTRGNGNNAVLMGSNTYNGIWGYQYMPFPGRQTLIWSNNVFDDIPSPCLKLDYIQDLNKLISDNEYDEVWILGGQKMFSHIAKENIQIQQIYLNYIDSDYNCDLFFPFELFHKNDKFNVIDKQIINKVNQYFINVNREQHH